MEMFLTINLYNFRYQIHNDDAKVRRKIDITKSFDKNLSFINNF